MHPHDLRQHYRPRADHRIPRWMWRVWAWL